MIKNTKNICRVLLLSGMLLSASACSDSFLQTDSPNQPSQTTYWQTESDAQGGLAGMYVKLRTESVENLFIWGELRSETLESEAIVGDNYMKYRENDLSATFRSKLARTLFCGECC